VSFKPGPEDCYRRCGSDKIRLTVPDTRSLMDSGGGTGGAALSGGDFQTARRGFVLIFVFI